MLLGKFILVIVFLYFILVTLIIASHWVVKKQEEIDDLSSDLPEKIRGFRNDLGKFNQELESRFTPKPMSIQEVGILIGDIIGDIVKTKLPPIGIGRNFIFFSIFYKLWRNRHRLMATFVK